MNSNLQAVVDYITLNPHHFKMDVWGVGHLGRCGTVGCIAGTALYLHRREHYLDACHFIHHDQIVDEAAQVLGLAPIIAKHLFLPALWLGSLFDSTFISDHEGLWHGNYRCDLFTIRDMENWAARQGNEHRIFNNIVDPASAVRCIKQLDETPHYVNWAKACDPDGWDAPEETGEHA